MSKLYLIESVQTLQTIVAAESAEKAKEIALSALQAEQCNTDDYQPDRIEDPKLIKSLDEIPSHWSGGCIPWTAKGMSESDETTIEEYLT